MINAQDAQKLVAAPLTGQDGEKFGTVADVLVDADSGVAEWLLVAVGPYGDDHAVVPADQATLDHRMVHVPYSRPHFLNAPTVQISDNRVPPEAAAVLRRYYGINTPD